MTFCHPRTGRCWANEAMAIEMDGPLVSPGTGLVQTGAYADNLTGAIQATQYGSQFWMNSNYTGPEPPDSVKAMYSTADYARDWIASYASGLVAQGVTVSPAVVAISNYPVTTNVPNYYPYTSTPLPGASVQAAAGAQTPGATGGVPAGAATNPGSAVSNILGGLGTVDWSSLIIPAALFLGALVLIPSLVKSSNQ